VSASHLPVHPDITPDVLDRWDFTPQPGVPSSPGMRCRGTGQLRYGVVPPGVARPPRGERAACPGCPDCTPVTGAALGPPRYAPPTTIAADPDDGPSAAEIAAVRALPLDARRALCDCRGPGWTVHPDGVAVPRLRPRDPALVGSAVDAWLPADPDGIIRLAQARHVQAIGQPRTFNARLADGRWDAQFYEARERGPSLRLVALQLLLDVWP
jgi:hypothetical protein